MMASFALLFAVAVLNLLALAHGQGRGALRLFRHGVTSTSYTTGILEIYYNDWGNICILEGFSRTAADVACHQLGYTGHSFYGMAGSGAIATYGTDSRSTVIDVDCSTSSYLALLQCSYSTVISYRCRDDYYDAYVSCYSTRIWNNPYSGQIRLTGGSYAGQGLLEVYCNGQWGTVCNDGFGSTDANVACRQLGYSSNHNYSHLSITGNLSQPIWLTNVPCSSSYTSCLVACDGTCPSLQVSNCGHNKNVTLECEFSTNDTTPSTTLSTCQYDDITPSDGTPSDSILDTTSIVVIAVVPASGVIMFILVLIIGLCLSVYGYRRRLNRLQNLSIIPMQSQIQGGMHSTLHNHSLNMHHHNFSTRPMHTHSFGSHAKCSL